MANEDLRVFTQPVSNSRLASSLGALPRQGGQEREKEEKEQVEQVPQPAATTQEKIDQASEEMLRESDLPESEKKKVRRDRQNIDKITNATARAAQAEAQGEEPSIKDKFLGALTFFLPEIVGGATGALIGGSEGLVAGVERGGVLGQQLRDAEIQQRQLGQKDRALDIQEDRAQMLGPGGVAPRALQQSDFIDVETGTPAIFNPNTGQYFTAEGEIIPAERIASGVQERFERSQSLREKGDERQSAKAAELSNTQVSSLANIGKVESGLNRIEKLADRVNTGILAGPTQSAGELAGLSSADFTQLKTETSNLINDYTKALSGAQVSEAEAVRIARVIPSVNDDDDVFKTKLNTFRDIVKANKGELSKAIEQGQPLKQSTINNMINKVDSALGEASREATKRGSVAVRGGMSEEQRKRLEELRAKYKGQ